MDIPTSKNSNLSHFMTEVNRQDLKTFHRWTVTNYQTFWQCVIAKLHIVFKQKPQSICNLSQGLETPQWLPGASMNIADSCFTAPATATAIIYQDPAQQLHTLSYAALDQLSNRVANSLIAHGFKAGDAIAIAMPMHINAVAIYLGIIKMGAVAVSIADSFSSQEIAMRLNIAKTKAIFTQDVISRGEKKLALYEKVIAADPEMAIVISELSPPVELRKNDLSWENFLIENSSFTSIACAPMAACNILFSSGTTAAPKAIPWNHTTPIKTASDAYFHQNIQPGDVLAWPTNLGWMMGPWLIFAAFINHAAIALYTDTPNQRAYGEFIQRAKVTMLGVVPTLVATWRQTKCMAGLNWNTIKSFSSTGECSNAEDMTYLMALAGGKPIIEYCGGTEIGGAYVTSTLLEKNYPALFSTPAMGIDFILLDENGQPADEGEVALIPPSIGLSTTLLNANHHEVYFANMPLTADKKILRRHGDHIKRLANGYYSMLGRTDDAMNLGGIKISAAEIERCLTNLPDIIEVAAVAITPENNGPSQLVIYAETRATLDKSTVMKMMQTRINQQLNPLFKIHDVRFVTELPKTASNKIMRRMLRN